MLLIALSVNTSVCMLYLNSDGFSVSLINIYCQKAIITLAVTQR